MSEIISGRVMLVFGQAKQFQTGVNSKIAR